MTEQFDFVRYFTRVQTTPFWHEMQEGMAKFAGVRAQMRVLDVGCGPGRLVQQLRDEDKTAVGVDADWRMLQQARALYGDLPVAVTLAERLPYGTALFDVVMAGNLLFFLPEPLMALQEMARVTKPTGCVVLWNPSEHMSQAKAAVYAEGQPDMDAFARKHIVNWAGVAESNRRWSEAALAEMFLAAKLVEFESKTTLGGLARYARGYKR